MFPNLRIIGGQELILNYALVIYQNTHLVEVGLPKLTAIINGGVRIMDNQQLCYSRYIDWGQILIGPANDILTDRNKGTESSMVFFLFFVLICLFSIFFYFSYFIRLFFYHSVSSHRR
ncbi:unnamed protein product [Gongylonema pulchrum]|uniref:Recep_L_domain domain-containing protein n=1 Tax=Gongylonema pulchrum TaxID=637853 RepID=A0A183F0T9_9BILA|nr:unnamed protein product [Gongylonema pulchrum]